MITSRPDSIDSQKKQGFANPLTWDWAYAFQWRHNVCLESSIEEALPCALWR